MDRDERLLALDKEDAPKLRLHYNLAYIQMVHWNWKATQKFPGGDDPLDWDYDLWQDVQTYEEVLEYETAVQLRDGIQFDPDADE